MFADGVYEVVRYYGGQPYAMQEHIDRLRGSLEAIRLAEPDELGDFESISSRLVQRNQLKDVDLYWQISRGSAPRGHRFPAESRPTVLAIAYPAEPLDPQAEPGSVAAVLAPDIRWHQCSIKSLMLLPNVLARNFALDAGVDEAILHRDGTVTEGTATSVLIVRGDEVWTHPADQWILGGITRGILLQLAGERGMVLREKTYTCDELLEADEVMICGTTALLAGVVKVDGRQIGQGGVGPVTRELHAGLVRHILSACGNSPAAV